MKTSTIPALKVEPKFRHAVESILHQGEMLSNYMNIVFISVLFLFTKKIKFTYLINLIFFISENVQLNREKVRLCIMRL